MPDITSYAAIIIKCLVAILAAIFLGNGAVYLFNKMPAKWFCDYGETPSEEMLDPFTQRIKSNPWKIVFTMFFVIIGCRMVIDDPEFAVAAVCTIWILLEIAIGDVLYKIIPDQLTVLLAVTAVGYFSYFDDWRHPAFGALAGLGLIGISAVCGRLFYGKDTVGGGDIKLFAALGLIAGPLGIAAIFAGSTVFACLHYIYGKIRGTLKPGGTVAMAPYVFISTVIYLVFFWGAFDFLSM